MTETMSKSKTSIIHVLIPHYNYIEGVKRTEKTLSPHTKRFLVTISDDSPKSTCKNHPNWIKGPSAGATKNWNFLLSKTKSSHCMLVHQDEDIVLLDQSHPYQLKTNIIYVCDLILAKKKSKIYLSAKLRCFLMNTFPKIIFTINFIGPTASLIIPKNSLRFNEELYWLVDIDYYYRLSKSYRFERFEGMKIHSNVDIGGSITNSGYLGSIPALRNKELSILGISQRRCFSYLIRIAWRLYRIYNTRKEK